MVFILKVLVLIAGLVVGVAFLKYNYQLTRLFGYNAYAEKYLGTGGTYSMWKILAIVVFVATFWYVFH